MLNAILQTLEELPNKKITDIFTDIFTDKLSKAELKFLEQIEGNLEIEGNNKGRKYNMNIRKTSYILSPTP